MRLTKSICILAVLVFIIQCSKKESCIKTEIIITPEIIARIYGGEYVSCGSCLFEQSRAIAGFRVAGKLQYGSYVFYCPAKDTAHYINIMKLCLIGGHKVAAHYKADFK